MSQSSSEKFLYFTVGLLKGSAALDALRQDATKHHMIDQPGQLIALRLTEYYEMMNQGIVQPVVHVPAVMLPPETETTGDNEHTTPSAETHTSKRPVPVPFPSPAALTNSQPQPAPTPIHAHTHTSAPSTDGSQPTSNLSQLSARMRALRHDPESVVTVSSAAEQNADEAADYWSPL